MEDDKLKPIAIVGMSFRFPGDANTTEGFWDILSKARSTRTKIPNDRFDPDGFYHPNADRPGAVITKEGCFLKEDVALFDAPFFGITASEAEGMDPQHRLLLEITYEAFENAGIPIPDVAGSDTGCYVGGFSSDYLLYSGAEINKQSMYQGTGCGNSMLSNRLSWFYDLRGPSFSIDTACSSSMVALHEACRDIQDGTTTMGVVAGSSLILVPGMWRALSSQRFLSPDGTCHSFDSQANGYGRGEGMGVLIVKPLADAIRDNDVIRAVIRGSGINQDGKTPAITVPNAQAQMSLIRSTYAKAGLEMNKTAYFEAHGTGTPVGDPLELLAIGQTIGAARSAHDQPVLVGSVKSNIGHLEGSSGIAGVIKAVLALEHAEIPAVAEFKSLNPRIKQDEWHIRIPTELTPWPTDGLRRASINSFGYGGSNGHVILDDARHYLAARRLAGNHNTVAAAAATTLTIPGTPTSQSSGSDSAISLAAPPTPPGTAPPPADPKLFVFSAPEQDGLARLASAYAQHLDADALPRSLKGAATAEAAEQMHNLAYTLSSRRTIFEHRSFAVADSLTGLQTALEDTGGLPKHGRRAGKTPSCAFVFTGQGAQWHAMGHELLRHAVFGASIADADAYMAGIMEGSAGSSWSLAEELCRDKKSSRINEPQLSQPLCTALQVALVDLLRHWGLQPKAVVGHSSGEIGAAYAAGVLSREDAWKIAYWRGVRSAQIGELAPGRKGAMMAAAMSEEAAQGYLARRVGERDVVVACVNSPNSVTISGDDFAVAEVEKLLTADKVWCRKLLVTTAYHSPHMKVIADLYRKDIEDISVLPAEAGGAADVTVFSSVTGGDIARAQMGTADYWVQNLVSPVRFSAAVTSLLKPRDARSRRKGVANVEALVELGPHSALQGPLRDILAAAHESFVTSVPYTPMLLRGASALQTAITAAGRLWCSGFHLDLKLVNSLEREPLQTTRPLVTLPRYPFNHTRRYWRDCRSTRWVNSHRTPRTDLLGQKTNDYNTVTPTWKNFLSPAEVPWLLDHKVHGLLITPGAVFLAMAMEACRDTADPSRGPPEGYQFRDIAWHKPLIFEAPDAHIETYLQLSPHKTGTKTTTSTWTRFSITTIDDATHEASEHCSGLVERKYADAGKATSEAAASWAAHKAQYAAFQSRPAVALTPRSMYDKLERIGLQFGPTFRNVRDVQSGDGFMTGAIATPDTAATMPEGLECPLPLHPAVLDAAIQMMAGAGRGEVPGVPLLPESIASLYVSATAPTAAGTVLTGYCTRVLQGAKASGTSVLSVGEEWEKPVVVLKNMVLNAAVGPQTGASSTGYARLDWMADVNHSRLPVGGVAPGAAAAAAAVVVDFVDAAGYVNPNLEMLEITGGTDTTRAAEILKRLGGKNGNSRITRYTWCNRDEADVEEASKTLVLDRPNECLELKVLDIVGDVGAQGFASGKLDCVILDHAALKTADLGTALQNVKTLLKPDGKLIIQAITGSPEKLDEAGWGDLLKGNGFAGVDQAFHHWDDPSVDQRELVIISSVGRETAFAYTNVLILTPPSPSDKVTKLAENCAAQLTQQGLTPTIMPWTGVVDMAMAGKLPLILSLLELDDEVFSDLSEDLFYTTKTLALRAGGMLWVTQAGNISGAASPAHNIASGLFRAVRSEDDTRPLASIDLSAEMDLVSSQASATIVRLFESLFGQGDIRGPDKEFAEDKGTLFVQRLVDDDAHNAAQAIAGSAPQPVADRLFQEGRKLTMKIGQMGSLDTLQFEDSDRCNTPLKPKWVEVKVLYAGLNFLDIMASLGEVPDPRLGHEVVGIVTEVGSSVTHIKLGDVVVGSTNSGGFASHTRLKGGVCNPIPHNISVQQAATIPIAFTTAWMGLVNLARMRKGETILIHSAAGGVGQAAIQLCQHFGVEVFATVGSTVKKELIMREYGVPEDHIFNSRDTTFADGVRRMTHGRGVDLVLNSVAGEFLRQSWHLVAPLGRFVEIGKRDILGNTGLDMEPFIRSVSFIGFNLDQYDEDGPEFDVVEAAQRKIWELVSAGKLRPLGPVNIFDFADAPKAFRALQSGKIVGKAILHANPSPSSLVPVVPRIEPPLTLDPNATYLLAGGLGGIGRSIATMLASHGARHLAFLSRSGASKAAAAALLAQLASLGCTATAYPCDIASPSSLSSALALLQSQMPPIRGVIQCAMTLRDAMFENMTYADWVACTAPKIQGSWNLHSQLPRSIQFFILLASTSGVIGNPGQANYAAGNTFEDALAHFRRRKGLSATALDIGAVRDVGYLAEANDQRFWSMSHLQSMTICEADIHFLIKSAITGHPAGSKQAVAPQIVAGLAGATIDEEYVDRSPWARDGKLCIALKASLVKKTAGMQAGMEALAKAETVEAARAIVEEILIRRVAVAVMVPEEDITVGMPLQTYGVNSLVAVEIKTWLTKELQAEITVGEISPSTISALAATIVATSKLLRGNGKKSEEKTVEKADAPAGSS